MHDAYVVYNAKSKVLVHCISDIWSTVLTILYMTYIYPICSVDRQTCPSIAVVRSTLSASRRPMSQGEILNCDLTSHTSADLDPYREVQLDLTPEMKVLHMPFEVCRTKNRSVNQQYFKFRSKV